MATSPSNCSPRTSSIAWTGATAAPSAGCRKLQDMLPPRALALVERACVENRTIAEHDVEAPAVLLSAIGQRFGITYETPLPPIPVALRPRRALPSEFGSLIHQSIAKVEKT
jgi:hypothetical protein